MQTETIRITIKTILAWKAYFLHLLVSRIFIRKFFAYMITTWDKLFLALFSFSNYGWKCQSKTVAPTIKPDLAHFIHKQHYTVTDSCPWMHFFFHPKLLSSSQNGRLRSQSVSWCSVEFTRRVEHTLKFKSLHRRNIRSWFD